MPVIPNDNSAPGRWELLDARDSQMGSNWPRVSDPHFSNVSLLLSGEGRSPLKQYNFTDNGPDNHLLTINGDVKTSGFSPFGEGWSNYFDGNGDYLSTPNTTANFDTQDFTVECWVFTNVIDQSNDTIISNYNTGSGNSLGLYINRGSNGGIQLYCGATLVLNAADALTASTWNHIAVSRSGTTSRIFVNGVQVASGTDSGNYSNSDNTVTGIGGASVNNVWGNYLNGYISNLRIVKGTAVYISNFTPPTSPLTAIANTSLLTCLTNGFQDLSTNNFAITRNGDVSVKSFNPYNLTNTTNNGSGYFDGTGDWLYYTPNLNSNFGTGDFTVEAWVYTNATGGYLYSSNTNGYVSFSCGTTTLAVQRTNVSNDTYSSTGIIPRMWNHVAYVRQSGVIKIFLNGTSLALTGANNTNNYNINTLAYIGAENAAAPFNGYISNLRIVKGTAVYTTNFTPPTQPLTPISNTSLLTLQYKTPITSKDFLDVSQDSNTITVPAGTNAVTNTFTPFGEGWSNYFDGTGDYLSISHNTNLNLVGVDFTIEGWVYYTQLNTGNMQIINKDGTASLYPSYLMSISSTGKLNGAIANASGATIIQSLTSTASVVANTWNHVAFTRSGSTLRIFINGIVDQTATQSITMADGGRSIGIGWQNGVPNSDTFYGYISNLRVIKGTAVYTSNFTPPTSPLTAIANTSLLTCLTNGFQDLSTNNFAITANGNTAVTRYNPFKSLKRYDSSDIGRSIYFDGTGDYLSLPSSPNLTLSGDFTIEFWAYATTSTASQAVWAPNSPASNRSIQLNGTSTNWIYYDGTTDRTIGSFVANTWNHIAISRSGSTIRTFLNGVLGTSFTDSAILEFSNVALGYRQRTPVGFNFAGYLSNFRLLSGKALYTTNFTPPTSPTTLHKNTVLALADQAGGIVDHSGNNTVETVGNAMLSIKQSKWGTSSLYFDGTGDYLVVSNNPSFAFGTGDFTIEGWVYSSGTVTNNGVFQLATTVLPGTVSGLSLSYLGQSNAWQIYYGAGTAVNLTSPAPVSNTWYHFSLSRQAGTLRVYINGTQGFTGSDSTSYTGQSLVIGGYYTSSYLLNGYIDDFRITRGVARYTANFTPPNILPKF